MNIINTKNLPVVALSALLLVGCSDSNEIQGSTTSATGSNPTTPVGPTTPVPEGTTNLVGQVTAGYAQCDVNSTDLLGAQIGAQTTSNTAGRFEIDLGAYEGGLVITASNCEYTDEWSNQTVTNTTFRSFVLPDEFESFTSQGTLTVQVTPFTELAFSLAAISAGSASPSAVELSDANTQFEDTFESMGFSYRTTAPVVATDADASSTHSAARDYGLALAAFSGSGPVDSQLTAIDDAMVDDTAEGLALLSDKLINGAAAFELTGLNVSGKSSIEVALSGLVQNPQSVDDNNQAPSGLSAEYSVAVEPGTGTTRFIPWDKLFTDADTDSSSLTYRIIGEPCGDGSVPTELLTLNCETPGEYEFFLSAMDPEGHVALIPATSTIETKISDDGAASFLMSATFGPTEQAIEEVKELGYSDWFQTQVNLPIDSFLERTTPRLIFSDTSTFRWEAVPREYWYKSAIYGEDQLRQRAAFAMSQILVVSSEPRDFSFKAEMQAQYMDMIQEGAFGNFRDLLEDVTYSPWMGMWLTYMGNQKANDETGVVPDENYAREIMQLFTVGLIELNQDGTPVLDSDGREIELYTNDDIKELAKVFTGLWWGGGVADFGEFMGKPNLSTEVLPMDMFDEHHSPYSKTFLGSTIPAGLPGDESITAALDILFNHPNVAPFISKQLIQRMTTSNPSPAYVQRVVDTFESGSFTLPDGQVVGTGERGDLLPVWAAILFEPTAMDFNKRLDKTYGKVREPLIRLLHWARFADIGDVEVINNTDFRQNGTQDSIGQNPYRSPSVFNFYRPGYVAPGTETASAGLVAPELQITTAATALNYANLMHKYVLLSGTGNWAGEYDSNTVALAEDPDALAEHLDLVLTAGRMSDVTRESVSDAIASVDIDDSDRNESLLSRVRLAVLLVVNSQEYITQQ